MKSLGKPVLQSGLGLAQVDTGNSNLGKSKFAGPVLNLRDELSSVVHHQGIVKTLSFLDEKDTQRFATQLAAQPALNNALVKIHGDLGAGKTTLVRYLLRALGITGRIKSPTYAVVEPYELPNLNIWHFDFYRFNDPREWEEAGFRDIFASPGLKLVEWPEKALGYLPQADLEVDLQVEPDQTRRVLLKANTSSGSSLISDIDGRGAA